MGGDGGGVPLGPVVLKVTHFLGVNLKFDYSGSKFWFWNLTQPSLKSEIRNTSSSFAWLML